MPKYRKKPVEIEAVQWFEGDQVDGVMDLAMISETWFDKTSVDGRYSVHTLEGLMQVRDGDWIITGVKGEQYPCKPDIFEMTYEPADPTPVQPDTEISQEDAREIADMISTMKAQMEATNKRIEGMVKRLEVIKNE